MNIEPHIGSLPERDTATPGRPRLQNARAQFALGIALVSVIPVLVFFYFTTRHWNILSETDFWYVTMSVLVLAMALMGYAILRQHPRQIAQIRQSVELLVNREMEDKSRLIRSEGDITAIEKGLGLLVEELRTKVKTAEHGRAALEQKLYRATKMESLDTMATGMAHDFNNFFTSILGNTSLALKTVPPGSPAAGNLREIEAASLSAVDLVNQMMLFSGKGIVPSVSVNLSRMIEGLRERLQENLPRNVTIEYDLDPDLPDILGDTTQLRRVIANLLSNAVDAENRKGTVSVSTGAMYCNEDFFKDTYLIDGLPSGQYVYLQVSDEGCGIPDEVQNRIFDPFFSTKLRGHGMGLAVAMGVVRAHGGAICIRNNRENGCTVTLVFPRVR